MIKRNFIGCKLYTVENEEVKIIRVLRRKSEEEYIIMDNNDFTTRRPISMKELEDKYTLLNPHGMISFNIAYLDQQKVGGVKDVIIMLGKENSKDYATCRQMIVDPFAEITGVNKYGLCMSRDTCPANIKYDAVKGCNGIYKSMAINVYKDDEPEVILELAKKIISLSNKILIDIRQKLKKGNGTCTTVKQLFEENHFWDEFDRMFGIKNLDDVIVNDTLNLEQLTFLEQDISYLMDDVAVVPFGYDINMGAIQSDYMLVRDKTKKIYLINYLKGSFISQKHMDDKELSQFTSVKK